MSSRLATTDKTLSQKKKIRKSRVSHWILRLEIKVTFKGGNDKLDSVKIKISASVKDLVRVLRREAVEREIMFSNCACSKGPHPEYGKTPQNLVTKSN